MPVLVSTRWLMADAEEWDEKEERRLHKTQDARQRPATFQTSDPPPHTATRQATSSPSQTQGCHARGTKRRQTKRWPSVGAGMRVPLTCVVVSRCRTSSSSLALFTSKLSLDSGFTRQPIHSGQSRITTSQPGETVSAHCSTYLTGVKGGDDEARSQSCLYGQNRNSTDHSHACMQRTTDDNMLSRVQT
ncbi:hypothetical protein E4U57_002604 [Claviceps arundinis]|uniref:Uncharacterized protein n=1 Tax=Claviceps arundinis TaxID=1623583 RepID=A0ABQ7P887_9HYPO|nr:hypothetical protein E4U57_002604 [Claviceps arundinis]